jgi:hypothetical protein
MAQTKVASKLHRIRDTIDGRSGQILERKDFDEEQKKKKEPRPAFQAKLRKYRQ